MEENNNYCETNLYEHKTSFFEKHPFLKHLFYGLLGLLGAFLAFYMVTDWYFKSMLDPVNQMKRMDKAIEKRDRQIEKNFKRAYADSRKMQEKTDHIIHLEQDNDEYKILVDLIPLNNNERNIEVNTKGNILTVKAAGIEGYGNKKSIMEITQSYMFTDNVDLTKLKKERKGDRYIITIPTTENDD